MNLSVGFLKTKHVKRVFARAIACGMLLVLPSCVIPPLRQAQPAPALPPNFNGVNTVENSSQLGVDEFFHDPMLTSLIDQALAGNRELRILEEEVQIAQNEILARRGAYLPFVTFGADAGLEKNSVFTPLGAAEEELEFRPGKHFPNPVGNYLLGFNIFWQVDIWRQLRNARDAAVQRYIAAIDRRDYFVTRLVADIAENYYGLMALDMRLVTLDQIIQIQEKSYEIAQARKQAGRASELPVQRFLAEIRKNQSEKLIVKQEIIEVENRINFLVNRFPQPVQRMSAGFFDLTIHALCVGFPAQLLLNRRDIQQAERELEAAGLDILVARANFFPRLDITAGVGYEALNPKYLFTPDALLYNAAGNLVAPVINRRAIRADYLSANARQLQSLYNYQRVILNAYTEVINRMSRVVNYSQSIAIKKQQLQSLETSVDVANSLFSAARVEYIDVLLAQRDLLDARTVLIETKREQLSAIVNAYQALGGGLVGVRGVDDGYGPGLLRTPAECKGDQPPDRPQPGSAGNGPTLLLPMPSEYKGDQPPDRPQPGSVGYAPDQPPPTPDHLPSDRVGPPADRFIPAPKIRYYHPKNRSHAKHPE